MSLHFYLISFLCTLMLISVSQCFNILVIFGTGTYSHYAVFDKFFEELGNRGHNVTILAHSRKNYSKNVRTIIMDKEEQVIVHTKDLNTMPNINSKLFYLYQLLTVRRIAIDCIEDLKSAEFQNFLKQDNKFDLVLGEMFTTIAYDALITKFKAPYIGFSTGQLLPWHYGYFGIPMNTAYTQNIFTGYDKPMRFFSRFKNTLIQWFSIIWYKTLMEREAKEYSKNYIGYNAADPHDAKLILTNTHYSITGAQILPPNVIEIGGIHIFNRKPKKLPNDIENWINNSKDGVIYFSLGSMIKSNTFPREQLGAFTRAFSKRSERVLWKWDSDFLPKKPDNVLLGKWMPQFDILCHPNVKLFISHGGLLGTLEALYCGVPVIVMPQFGDQVYNAYAIKNLGFGEIINIKTVSEAEVSDALTKILNPKIYENVKLLSQKFKDRPLSPMDTAIYWVEYVAKYKDVPEIRSPVTDLPFYQYYLLDVFAVLFIILILTFYIIYLFFKQIYKLSIIKNTKVKTQ